MVIAALGLAAVSLAVRSQPRANPDPPLRVAETLDRLVQPRFRRFDLGFGVIDRLVRVRGHQAVRLQVNTAEEKRLLAEADGAGHRYIVGFLHSVHVPATAYRNARGQTVRVSRSPGAQLDRPELRFVAGSDAPRARPGSYATFSRARSAWQVSAVKALPRLRRGQPANVDNSGWLLAMRPVRASERSCLTCHTRSKRGDTLGVMVYAVRRRPGTD